MMCNSELDDDFGRSLIYALRGVLGQDRSEAWLERCLVTPGTRAEREAIANLKRVDALVEDIEDTIEVVRHVWHTERGGYGVSMRCTDRA